ncbi:hypothetical protein NPX96_33875, partial [Bacillus cereus]|uniref:maltose acetyltransferase domain-containing protein n=1 Tax=Bacillus cereus TaxID=1396 RepID=UPI0021117EDC|nr:hypothetical protein [Bacillus cereus]
GMRAFEQDVNDPRSAHERMVAGDWYIAEAPEIQQAFRHALAETARFSRAYPEAPDGSQEILRGLLGTFGEGAHVRAPLSVDYGTRL